MSTTRSRSLALAFLATLAMGCCASCSRDSGTGTGPGKGPGEWRAELRGRPLRVLVMPVSLPVGAGALGNDAAQAEWLKAMARRAASALGLSIRFVELPEDLAQGDEAFRKADVVAAAAGLDAWRGKARLLPFLPLPGTPATGSRIAYWASAPGKPLLAAALAQALAASLREGGAAADLDGVLGPGSAERYFASVGYDGILRAQYLDLAGAQAGWVEERRQAGAGIKVAIRKGNIFAYVPQPDGSVRGFDYDLLVALANSLGLPFELTVVDGIAAFFTKDGVTPPDLGTGAYDYTPDLLRMVDLYANPFGVTPWRERLMRMLTIYPLRNLLAGRKGEEVSSVTDLDGKRFAVIKDSVQQKTLAEFAASRGLGFSFVYGENEDRLYELVRQGRADYILDGSVVFALNVDKIGDFGLSPFFSELQGVAWAVKKDDGVFAGLLESFLDASRQSGLLPALWQKTFRMDYEDYVAAMLAAEEGAQ